MDNNETKAHMDMKNCNYLQQKLMSLLTTATNVQLNTLRE